MIMINFINFVFSLKSKHENEKKTVWKSYTVSRETFFCFPEK